MVSQSQLQLSKNVTVRLSLRCSTSLISYDVDIVEFVLFYDVTGEIDSEITDPEDAETLQTTMVKLNISGTIFEVREGRQAPLRNNYTKVDHCYSCATINQGRI